MLDRIQVTHEVEQMCCVKRGVKGEPAPIPQEGEWTKVKKIEEISFSDGFILPHFAKIIKSCFPPGKGV